MQHGQNKRVQQAEHLLRLSLERNTRVPATSDQLVDERMISCHVLLEYFWRHPPKDLIIILAREKLQEGNRFHAV